MSLVRALAAVVGPEHVLTDPSVTRGYETDWLGRHAGPARLVVRPGTLAEVVGVLGACRLAGVAVVPQGGNTGLVGGGVPHEGEVVLSTRRLLDGFALDEAASQVSVPAGMTVAEVQRRLGPHGLELGVDLASRDSATVGGLVATNAGGLRVPRFGHVRQQLVGVEAVLADGSVLRQMSGLRKDNTGYHWPSLLCGSEGTLAVVTAARLQVFPTPRQRVVLVVGCDDLTACLEIVRALRSPELASAEVVFADGVDRVVARGARRVTSAPCELHVELAGDGDQLAQAARLEGEDVHVATDGPGRQGLWERRERHPEVVSTLPGVPLKLDTAVPLGSLADYEKDVRRAVADADPAALLVMYGHVADGNLHVNVATTRPEAVRDAVLGAVVRHEGSISAEHGIGYDKRDLLHRVRSGDEVAAMRALKAALDPASLLNPCALLPSGRSSGALRGVAGSSSASA
jgi:FAD/FMN-containing dehydrogenase